MALVAGRRPPTEDRPFHFQATQWETGGRQSFTETGFFREFRLPAVNIIPLMFHRLLIHSFITDGKQSK